VASFRFTNARPTLSETPTDDEIGRETRRVLALLGVTRPIDVWTYRGPRAQPISGATFSTAINYMLPEGVGRQWIAATVAHECAHVATFGDDHNDEWRAAFVDAMCRAYGIQWTGGAWPEDVGKATSMFAVALARAGW
jgi:hypothetical protein